MQLPKSKTKAAQGHGAAVQELQPQLAPWVGKVSSSSLLGGQSCSGWGDGHQGQGDGSLPYGRNLLAICQGAV